MHIYIYLQCTVYRHCFHLVLYLYTQCYHMVLYIRIYTMLPHGAVCTYIHNVTTWCCTYVYTQCYHMVLYVLIYTMLLHGAVRMYIHNVTTWCCIKLYSSYMCVHARPTVYVLTYLFGKTIWMALCSSLPHSGPFKLVSFRRSSTSFSSF